MSFHIEFDKAYEAKIKSLIPCVPFSTILQSLPLCLP